MSVLRRPAAGEVCVFRRLKYAQGRFCTIILFIYREKGSFRAACRTAERFVKDDIHIKITEMKRITLLLAAVALLVGSAATAQDLRREERTMKRYGQQAENEMRREMRGVRAEERRAENEMRREMRGVRAEERRAENEMRREMRRAERQMQHMHTPARQAVKVVSYRSTMVGDLTDLDFMINFDGVMLDPNEEFVITPYLVKGENMLWLEPVVIVGERRYKELERGEELNANPSG